MDAVVERRCRHCDRVGGEAESGDGPKLVGRRRAVVQQRSDRLKQALGLIYTFYAFVTHRSSSCSSPS
jgi:hypothetical protein